jgi:outer membrane immunogenic protein
VGWAGGGGAEFAITRRWSVRLEFLYYDLGDQTFTASPNPPFQVRNAAETTTYTINGGLNFKF